MLLGVLSIGTRKYPQEIRSRLIPQIESLARRRPDIDVRERRAGDHVFWEVSLSRGDDTADPFVVSQIAQALTGTITSDIERSLVKELISRSPDLSQVEDAGPIAEEALRILRVRRAGHSDFGILMRILDWLSGENRLHLDGFLRFRLKDYMGEVVAAVETAVDNYLVEKDYKEFIRLLKYFVDIQEPRFEEVNVIMLPDGSFRLLDDRHNIIESDCLEDGAQTPQEGEVDYEDLLISALVTLAPQRIILHFDDTTGVGDTIRSVFEERITQCKGCSLCPESRGAKFRRF